MPLKITYDKIVIGASLEALLFAFYGKHKIIYTRDQKPDVFEKLQNFGIGTSRYEAWNKHIFQLSLGGYIPFAGKIKHVRYVDSNKIKVVTHEESVVTIKYNKLYVFDDFNFLDLPPSLTTTSDKIKLIDWFQVEKGKHHNFDVIDGNTNFMNQVIFFKSGRRSDSNRKDVCSISFCKEKEIEKFPEHLIKIKTEGLMKSLGIEENPRINHIKRDIIVYGQNIYDNFDNIEFIYDDAKTIYEINQRRHKIDYMKYLRLKLGI